MPRVISLSDVGVLLAGYGSTVDDGAVRNVRAHADNLRLRGVFAGAEAGFWKCPPFIPQQVERLPGKHVVVVPMAMADGHFVNTVLPDLLSPGHQKTAGSRPLSRTLPIGTHPEMAALLRARATTVLSQHPFPTPPRLESVSLMVAGHGTPLHPDSRKAVEMHVASLKNDGRFADVQALFIEEAPLVSDWVSLAQTRHVVVVPFFMQDGPHCQLDIPIALGATAASVKRRLEQMQTPWRNPTEKHGRLVWYSPAVGTHPELADVITARIHEAITGQSTDPEFIRHCQPLRTR